MSETHVLIETRGPLGLVTLNRPEKLNALSLAMMTRIKGALDAFAADPAVAAVAIRSASPKAFSAGGDIRAVYDFGRDGASSQVDFFATEYRLDHAVAAFPKPFIAFMDGVVMGGGAGISAHGRYRVGGDGLRFAMPETAIGLSPDVGATFFLGKAPRRLGFWAGASGAAFGPAEAMAANVVDYLTPSARFETVIGLLAAADYSEDPDEAICEILALNGTAPPPASFKPRLDEIEAAFSAPTALEAVRALETGSDWARAEAATIRARCPFAVALFHEACARRPATAAEALTLEFRATRACLARDDFYDGVRAVLVDKTRDARWTPATLEEVDPAAIRAALAPRADDLAF